MFKVGDVVKRVRGEDSPSMGMFKGNCYLITKVTNPHAHWLILDQIVGVGGWDSDNFELATKETMITYNDAPKPNAPVSHKHAALIKLWADNPETKFQRKYDNGTWSSPRSGDKVYWEVFEEIRVYQEPKADKVYKCFLKMGDGHSTPTLFSAFLNEPPTSYNGDVNLKLTFDGETGKLKAVELV